MQLSSLAVSILLRSLSLLLSELDDGASSSTAVLPCITFPACATVVPTSKLVLKIDEAPCERSEATLGLPNFPAAREEGRGAATPVERDPCARLEAGAVYKGRAGSTGVLVCGAAPFLQTFGSRPHPTRSSPLARQPQLLLLQLSPGLEETLHLKTFKRSMLSTYTAATSSFSAGLDFHCRRIYSRRQDR